MSASESIKQSYILTEQRCSELQQRKNQLGQRSDAVNSKAAAAAASAAAKSLQSCPTLCDPIDGSPLGCPVPGFSRQEHWSGLPFPSPMHESEK